MDIAQGNENLCYPLVIFKYSDFCHRRTKIQQFKIWLGVYKMWLEEPGLLHVLGQVLEDLQSKLQDKELRQHVLRNQKA